MGAILHGLSQTAAELRDQDEQNAREAKLAQERAEQRRQGEIQHKKFEEDLANWAKAEDIRRFIDRVEQASAVNPPNNTEYTARWLAWGRAIATGLDPLSEGTDDFFQHYLELGWDKMTRRK